MRRAPRLALGLRQSVDRALDELAADRDADRAELARGLRGGPEDARVTALAAALLAGGTRRRRRAGRLPGLVELRRAAASAGRRRLRRGLRRPACAWPPAAWPRRASSRRPCAPPASSCSPPSRAWPWPSSSRTCARRTWPASSASPRRRARSRPGARCVAADACAAGPRGLRRPASRRRSWRTSFQHGRSWANGCESRTDFYRPTLCVNTMRPQRPPEGGWNQEGWVCVRS